MAAADTAPTPSPRQILEHLNSLSQRQKLAGAALVAILIALIVGSLLWSRAPDYSVLFANLEERDGGAIVTALQAQNIPYRVGPGGSSILVPADQVHETRLRLAAEGLPRGGLVGFEVMENQRLGVSQFLEQVNFQRALEGELSRTIQSISSVAAARVHLAMPKQSGFLRDEQKPSASVMVTLHAGRVLDPAQIAGIVHLISSSVPKMSNDGVSVIDQHGNLLTGAPKEDIEDTLNATQLKYVREIEAAYLRRIEGLLTPMVGSSNFRAQITANVDFNRVEETAETYRPNPAPNQAIRSQQTNEQFSGVPDGGVPGALTNQPPVPATAPIVAPPAEEDANGNDSPINRSRSATLNYELDRNIQHIRHATGQVRKISVAVVLRQSVTTPADGSPASPMTPEDLERIRSLIQSAVGYDPERGDVVEVSSAPFALSEMSDDAVPFWKDPTYLDLAKALLKPLLILLALIFLYFAVIRPLMRSITASTAEAEAAKEAARQAAAEEDDFLVKLSENPAHKSFEHRLANARELAKSDPKAVANLIRSWMAGEEKKK